MKRLYLTLTTYLVAQAVAAGADLSPIGDKYGAVAQRLISAALADDKSTDRLEYLCDRIGNRLSGSASLERAIEWAATEMKRAGLENVQTPPVKVPHWVRGKESAVMLAPLPRSLSMIGLGMSVGTPPEGIEAEVVPVENPDKLTALGRDKVAGKIVLFTADADDKTYRTPGYRQAVTVGPSRAAALGAVAVLVKSGYILQNPRTTGGMDPYGDGVPKIPAAAVSVEDALSMQRLVARGVTVRVHLVMDDHQEPDADSHNVMGELRGREKPEEVVVLGGHIDSWDVGQGANDDGSGMMSALEAVLLVKKLGLHPRRTMRVVFWVNEENGGAGGRAYRAIVGDAVKNHVAAIEMDNGAERPLGFAFGAADQDKRFPGSFQRAVEIGALLRGIDGGRITPKGGGGDIRSLTADGVPGFAVKTVETLYSNWHHTNADTFDKIVKREFQLNVASLAVLSYVLADMPERLSDLK